MTKPENWPEELTDDMEVLFIKPYTPEEARSVQMAVNQDEAVKQAFMRANARDPDFQKFEDTIATYKTVLGLGGYILGDDLILLYGDKEDLQKVYDGVKDEYACFFDTVGKFLSYLDQDNPTTVIPENKPTLH